MDIRLLEAFRAVLDSGSMTQAAASLGLTQPAVSAQIARLEADLGFDLFERSGNRVRPTSEAHIFRRDVDDALEGINDLARAAERIRLGTSGAIRIAAHPMAGVTLLPPVIAEFRKSRPGVRVELLTRNSDLIRGMFPSRTLDLGVAETPIDPTGLVSVRYRMECVAALPKGHPLGRFDIVTPALLSGAPFVGVSGDWAAYHLVRSAFAEAGAHLNVVATSDLFAVICGLVANGVGVSIVDPATAAQFRDAGLELRPFRPTLLYEIALFHSAEPGLSLTGRAFRDAFDAHLRTLAPPTP